MAKNLIARIRIQRFGMTRRFGSEQPWCRWPKLDRAVEPKKCPIGGAASWL